MDNWDIRRRLEKVVHDKLRADHGDTAIIREPLISELTGHNFGDQDTPADPLQAIKASTRIEDLAHYMGGEYARAARRHGRSWDEIADAFGIDPDEVDDPAVEAYQRVAGTEWDATTSWQCACCTQRVTDRGPWDPHPSDNETGHAADCARHQREVTAYERRRDGYDQDRVDEADWEMDL